MQPHQYDFVNNADLFDSSESLQEVQFDEFNSAIKVGLWKWQNKYQLNSALIGNFNHDICSLDIYPLDLHLCDMSCIWVFRGIDAICEFLVFAIVNEPKRKDKTDW